MNDKQKWYNSDLFIYASTAIGFIAMVVLNYINHGGRLVW